MSLFKLPRRARYGNTGAAFNEGKPRDDQYLFKAENTRDVWAQLKTISEQFGLDFFADASGDFVLRTRNNPHVGRKILAQDFSTASTTGKHPNAYGGTFQQFTGTVTLGTITVQAARIDLVLPRGPSLGSWTATVKQGATTVAGPMTLNPANAELLHYYDYRTTVDGTNATVVTLYSGFFNTYTVELSSSGGTGSTVRYLDSLMLWHTDPANPLIEIPLSTEDHALSVDTRSMMNDMRNHVIVVGRRNAAVTDSQKGEVNPENPSYEFVVASSTDVGSVAQPFLADGTTPTPNYVGYPKESIIYDESIADKDFAEYVARTFIYRQRKPLPAANIEHTLLPDLQLREPVEVVEQPYDTLDASTVQYVQSIRHSISMGDGIKALTAVETNPYPEYPSYEVREDIDIDTHYNGSPVADVLVEYTSLSNHAKQNLPTGLVEPPGQVYTYTAQAVSGGAISMTNKPWPPLPGSVFIKQSGSFSTPTNKTRTYTGVKPGAGFLMYLPHAVGAPTAATLTASLGQSIGSPLGVKTYNLLDPANAALFHMHFDADLCSLSVIRKDTTQTWKYTLAVTYPKANSNYVPDWLTNTPYQHLFEVDYRDSNRQLQMLWKQGDGSSLYTIPGSTFDVKYRALGPVSGGANTFTDPYAGNVPFYDPYTSELGNNVTLTFSALVSGEYRISIRSRYDDTVVAYLTDPAADPADEELHWQYLDAGTNKQFVWDGVDQVGEWNRRQSADYADLAYGAFAQDSVPLVGGGFYVWNREEAVSNGFPQLGLISGLRDATSEKPVFGAGTFAEWYVHFEVRNDTLEALAESDDLPYPRVVRSDAMNWGSGDVQAVIYTHLPEPTKVELEVADWNSTALFDPENETLIDTPANWTTDSSLNTDLTINNQRPVRLRFQTQSRPGALWAGKTDQVAMRLHRVVHLRYNLHDQFVVYDGSVYPGTSVPNRRVVNRRLTVDDHTLVFEDDAWRTAATLRDSDGDTGLEWIFTPNLFRKNFRGIEDEPLQFGDYLQLEEVPSWDTTRSIANARSRLNVAFINYLFYLSAYTQDRSGRFTWCLNRSFLDKSKILQNDANDWLYSSAKPTPWPDDMNKQFRRTVVTRQWTNERTDSGQLWYQAEAAKWNFTPSSVGYNLLTHDWKDHDPTSTTLRGPDGTTRTWASFNLKLDYPSDFYESEGKLASAWNNYARQLGNLADPTMGDWTWETDPLWIPCISRDFHGYFLLPPMPDVHCENFRRNGPLYASVDPREYDDEDDEDNPNTGDDPAAAKVWNSPAKDMTDVSTPGLFLFRGKVVTPDKDPTKVVTANMHDYSREDSLVHFEDCRGLWSRGPRPAEQAKKVEPITPYYQNLYRYTQVIVQHARQTEKSGFFGLLATLNMLLKPITVSVINPVPLYRARVGDAITTGNSLLNGQNTNGSGYHDMTFRGEYLWESSRFFPAKKFGRFWSRPYNADKVQVFDAKDLVGTFYDGGAWTGWKDDSTGTTLVVQEGIDEDGGEFVTNLLDNDIFTGNPINVFQSLYPPFAVGPKLSTTRNMRFHMLLVNERRATEI